MTYELATWTSVTILFCSICATFLFYDVFVFVMFFNLWDNSVLNIQPYIDCCPLRHCQFIMICQHTIFLTLRFFFLTHCFANPFLLPLLPINSQTLNNTIINSLLSDTHSLYIYNINLLSHISFSSHN